MFILQLSHNTFPDPDNQKLAILRSDSASYLKQVLDSNLVTNESGDRIFKIGGPLETFIPHNDSMEGLATAIVDIGSLQDRIDDVTKSWDSDVMSIQYIKGNWLSNSLNINAIIPTI